MFDLEPCFFQTLEILKDLHDADMLEDFCKKYGKFTPDDSYDLHWEAALSVFPDYCDYYKAEEDTTIFVFFDPLLDELGALSRRYEMLNDIRHEDNLLWDDVAHAVDCNMQMNSYDYGWRFYDNSHGRSRLVLLLGCEFYSQEELTGALCEVRWAIKVGIQKFKKALDIKDSEEKAAENGKEAA